MPPFYGWGSTVSRLQSHNKETVYFLSFSSQEFLVLSWSTSEGWKAELTLEPPRGFEAGTPGLGIQSLNHLAGAGMLVFLWLCFLSPHFSGEECC